MRKGVFIAGNFLLIFSAFLFCIYQFKSISGVFIPGYFFRLIILALALISLLMIILNFPVNWKRKYFVLIPALIISGLIVVISGISANNKFNSEVIFEAVSANEWHGALIIVIRANHTYKLEDSGLFGSYYYYGDYTISSDTLILSPDYPNGMFASGRFLILKDSLYEFGNEGQLINDPEYAYLISNTK